MATITKPRKTSVFDSEAIVKTSKRARSMEALAKSSGHDLGPSFTRRVAALTKEGRLPEGRFWKAPAKAA